MQIQELMTEDFQAVRFDHTIADAAILMRDLDVGMLPVVDEQGDLVGTITDRDIAVRAVAADLEYDSLVEAVMSPDPVSCTPDEDVESVAQRMKSRQIRRMPVTNGHDHLEGVVSVADIARYDRGHAMSGDVLEGVSRPSAAPRNV